MVLVVVYTLVKLAVGGLGGCGDGRFGLIWFEYDWFGLGDGCWVCLILIGGWGVCYLVGDCVSLVGCGLV